MYVFMLNGHFDALLDMPLKEAEVYVVRRFVACGETPCYRHFYPDVIDDCNNNLHFVEYGTYLDGKYFSPSRLKCVEPKTSLKGEWEVTDRQSEMTAWAEFLAAATDCGDDYYEIIKKENKS